jgi:hypothetical protein
VRAGGQERERGEREREEREEREREEREEQGREGGRGGFTDSERERVPSRRRRSA